MNDAEIESEILRRKNLIAPRVTLERVESAIVGEDYYVFPGSTVTVCLLKLANGFTCVGKSACASPENFDEELGRKIARENAKQKIWPLEGYLLKQKLYEAENEATD